MRLLFAWLAVWGAGILGAQEQVIGTVTTVLTVGSDTVAQRQYTIRASVLYLDTLEADKYVDSGQVSLEVQRIIQEYPNKQAAVEAVAAAICTQILQKYPQFLGFSVGFTNTNSTLATTAARTAVSAPVTIRSAIKEELRRAVSGVQ